MGVGAVQVRAVDCNLAGIWQLIFEGSMKSDQLVRSGFPTHWRIDDAPVRYFDWRVAEVDIPYVLLVTGRCGSEHLVSMLTSSGGCGEPLEYFNEDGLANFPEAAAATCLEEYIGHIARRRSRNRRFGFKIDHWRWKALQALVDVEALFPRGRSVFLLMTRQDIVAQAYSFAVARATTIWHERVGSPPVKAQVYVPADREILQELALIARGETGLSRYLKRSGRLALRFSYEQLLQDPQSVLRRIGGALALEPASLDKLAASVSTQRQLQYEKRDEHIESFRLRFARELAFLDSCRGRFPYKAFRGLVLESRGIDVGTWHAA